MPATLLKERLKCLLKEVQVFSCEFCVNFSKFFKSTILQNTFDRLLLTLRFLTYYHWYQAIIIEPISCHWSVSIPPENIRKPEVS